MEENKFLKEAGSGKNTALLERHKIVILEGLPGVGKICRAAIEKIHPQNFLYLDLQSYDLTSFLSQAGKKMELGSLDRALSFLVARSQLGKLALHESSMKNIVMLRYFPNIEVMEEINPKNLEIIQKIIGCEYYEIPDKSIYKYVLVDIDYNDKSQKTKLDFLQFERLRKRYTEIAISRNWLMVKGEELNIFLKTFFEEE